MSDEARLLIDAEQGRKIAEIANSFGWNGVENSKLLSDFIHSELSDLARMREKFRRTLVESLAYECPNHQEQTCANVASYHAVRNGTGLYLCGDCILSTDEHR